MASTSTGGRRNSSGLARDLEILELLSSPEARDETGLSVTAIAQSTGRDKGAISRALATLADFGFVERNDESRTYALGPQLFAMASRSVETALSQRMRPALRQIALATGETSHLCVLRGGNVLTIASELSPHQIRTNGWEGVTTSAWRTPSGRVLLSDWDTASITRWYAEHGTDKPVLDDDPRALYPILDEPKHDRVLVRDLESLLSQIATIRQQGFALSDEELESGVVAASAPIRDFTGHVIAALNVSGPRTRMVSRLQQLGTYVAESAERISTHLGFAPHSAG
ncbi:IclR family transcriptional regulator [Gulosibacter faecalis]|jgi:DNA-binding IclR family transcriptional regulator|uniref:IclR family transcriptional regulator n=1 Tax=Gulosibacter faecalis TaxID=272240 RepID=A0ABW5UZ85_9MICO|nr:IclR family transcriptional regulator [Gulosibacter faecalis]